MVASRPGHVLVDVLTETRFHGKAYYEVLMPAGRDRIRTLVPAEYVLVGDELDDLDIYQDNPEETDE